MSQPAHFSHDHLDWGGHVNRLPLLLQFWASLVHPLLPRSDVVVVAHRCAEYPVWALHDSPSRRTREPLVVWHRFQSSKLIIAQDGIQKDSLALNYTYRLVKEEDDNVFAVDQECSMGEYQGQEEADVSSS